MENHEISLPATGIHADGSRFKIARDRDESEPCERLTPGCCVQHESDDECETW